MSNTRIGKTKFLAEVIAAGRITIPKTVRKILGIKEGDFVKVEIIEVIRR